MEFKNIKLDITDQVATITLNQPTRLNACSLNMADDIFTALDVLEDARALIITGEGRAFCAGADLQATSDSAITGGKASFAALNQHYNPLMLKLAKLNIPTITAVNGPAAGIGCSIGLASDFAIAGKSAYFLQAFVNIGLVPDGGASWMLTRLVGKARATEMMMLGEKISGEKAADWGLIYKCVEDDALMTEAGTLAKRLADGPTVALGVMRQNLAKAMESDYASAMYSEAEGQRLAGDSNDAREGAIAFLQKRKTEFKGQ
ncbi:MAG: enoyl-CoA hydratase-related protein [Parasphingorhabdus sp.]|uniref:enoyl-CoA hydratase-related protein n=1 Tax=Parasphingorhabdus sp. TaxID=2709688 RepID=UPI003002BCA4